MGLAENVEYYSTWDEVVECCDDLSHEDSKSICSLGYYGKQVKDGDVKKILEGVPWTPEKKYTLTYNGVDGAATSDFDTLEEAAEYIKGRYQRWTGEHSFGSDYANWSLHGFTMSDCGISNE